MLINTVRFQSGDLQLNAYSNSTEDFVNLESKLREVDIEVNAREIAPKTHHIYGKQYELDFGGVSRFAKSLDGKIGETGHFTTYKDISKNSYSCKELSVIGLGNGCENISADNKNDADLTCAMIAGNNNWLGGDVSEGSCP